MNPAFNDPFLPNPFAPADDREPVPSTDRQAYVLYSQHLREMGEKIEMLAALREQFDKILDERNGLLFETTLLRNQVKHLKADLDESLIASQQVPEQAVLPWPFPRAASTYENTSLAQLRDQFNEKMQAKAAMIMGQYTAPIPLNQQLGAMPQSNDMASSTPVPPASVHSTTPCQGQLWSAASLSEIADLWANSRPTKVNFTKD